MAPAKRKATSSPPPPVGRSAARLSGKTSKMTNQKSDAEEETKTRAPRVQLPHACKERLDELTRSLDFKTFGSTVDFLLPTLDGAKQIRELSKDLGYDNGGQTIDWLLDKVRAKEFLDFQNERRQLDWLLPTEIERLQGLTRELGFQRGGQTVDWLLQIASKDFLKLGHFLGVQDSANTIQFLLDQAKPAIGARFGRHSASAGTVGYTGPYSSTANQPFPIPQFSQMPQGVTPNSFAGIFPRPTPTGVEGGNSSNPHTSIPTPTGGLGGGTIPTATPIGGAGGGSTAWYSSNPQTSNLSPTGELGGTIPTPTPTGGGGSTPIWYSSNPHTSIPRPTDGLGGGAIHTPTPTGGVEGGTTTWYSSNLHASVPTPSTPTPVHSSTGPVTAHRSALPMPNTYLNGFHGGRSQMKGDGQFQGGYVPNNGMFNSSRMTQPMSFTQSEISTRNCKGKSQQASVENNQFHNGEGSRLKGSGQLEDYRTACTGNIVGPGEGASAPIIPVQNSINSYPNHNPASVHYGDRGIRVDQLQTPPQVNQLISQGSNPLHESQQATVEHIQFHNRADSGLKGRGRAEDYRSASTGNIVEPGVGVGVSTPIIPAQHSINSQPSHNPVSVHYGDRGIRVDQMQAPPQVNQLISQDSNSLREIGRTLKAQNRSRAMQPTVKKAVKNGRRASNRVTRTSSRFPNPNPPQEIIEQVQAPAHQIRTERRTEGHEVNQLIVHSHCNGGQSPSIEFPIDIRCTQGNEATHMAGLPFMMNQILEANGAGVQIPADHIGTERRMEYEANQLVHSHCNGGQSPSIELPIDIRCTQCNEETHMAGLPLMRNQTLETETQSVHIYEFENIETETQTEKKQEVNYFVNIETETQGNGETHMAGFPFMRNQILEINGAGVQNNNHQRLLNGAQQEGNELVNIETSIQTEKQQEGNELVHIEIETQTEKRHEVNEFVNIETETQTEKRDGNESGNIEIETQTEKKQQINEFGNIEIETQTEKQQEVNIIWEY